MPQKATKPKLSELNSKPKPNKPKTGKKGMPKDKKKRIIIAAIGVLFILASGGLLWYLQNQPPQQIAKYIPDIIPTPTPELKNVPNPLNGVLYTQSEAKQFLDKRPLAVMVENHVHARPQAGLAEAEVLYEAMAEGGITRFMSLYLANSPEKITPVRSARLHFVDWAAEYDAAYAHWGGSTEALNFLRSNNRPKDLDQFIYGGAFFRDHSTGRSLEHTGATSVEGLRQVIQSQGWFGPGDFSSWTFKDDMAQDQRPDSHTATLGFLGTFGYNASFSYNPESNTYVRSTGGQPHMDANGQQLSAKTIILMYQQVTPYNDSNGNPAVDVDTIGSGDAVVIQDGSATTGSWQKSNRNARTKITNNNGQTIKLNRGKIWVISVPVGSPVSY